MEVSFKMMCGKGRPFVFAPGDVYIKVAEGGSGLVLYNNFILYRLVSGKDHISRPLVTFHQYTIRAPSSEQAIANVPTQSQF